MTELQQTMPMREVMLWVRYRAKHGPMSLERMVDRPAALLAFLLNRSGGGKATMKSFMPTYGSEDEGEEAGGATIDEFVEELGKKLGGVKIGKRKSR